MFRYSQQSDEESDYKAKAAATKTTAAIIELENLRLLAAPIQPAGADPAGLAIAVPAGGIVGGIAGGVVMGAV